jgi:hypothetical protein
MLNSVIMSGIAGNNIVSPYIVIKIDEPKIAKVIHAEVEIVFLLSDVLDDAGPSDDGGGLLVLFVLLVSVFFSSTIYLDQIHDKKLYYNRAFHISNFLSPLLFLLTFIIYLRPAHANSINSETIITRSVLVEKHDNLPSGQ